jgi:hypothetical protein
MSNMITVPGVGYKMDKIKFIIVLVVVILVIMFIANPGGFVSTLVKKLVTTVGDTISGAVQGVGEGIYAASGQQAIDQASDSYSARIDNYWKGSTWVNWMTSDLYNANPTDVSIDEATAMNLYNNVRSAEGSSLFGVTIYEGDMTGILTDFQSVVGNKTDISYVSFIANQQSGQNLGQIFQDVNNFYNNKVGTSGEMNVQMMAEFLDWANGLPVN